MLTIRRDCKRAVFCTGAWPRGTGGATQKYQEFQEEGTSGFGAISTITAVKTPALVDH